MDFKEYVFRAEMIEEEKTGAIKNLMIAAAFAAWQIGAGPDMPWNEYLDKMGLSENQTLSPEQKKQMAEKTIENAEKARETIRKIREKEDTVKNA